MINPKKIEEIAQQISQTMPEGVKNIAESIENKTKQVLQQKLSQMDFVSREEFEIQNQVLLRTREKLSQLEAKVAELERLLEKDHAVQPDLDSESTPESN